MTIQNWSISIEAFETDCQLFWGKVLQSFVPKLTGFDFEKDIFKQLGLSLKTLTNGIKRLFDDFRFLGFDDHDEICRVAKVFGIPPPSLLKRCCRVNQIGTVCLKRHRLKRVDQATDNRN